MACGMTGRFRSGKPGCAMLPAEYHPRTRPLAGKEGEVFAGTAPVCCLKTTQAGPDGPACVVMKMQSILRLPREILGNFLGRLDGELLAFRGIGI